MSFITRSITQKVLIPSRDSSRRKSNFLKTLLVSSTPVSSSSGKSGKESVDESRENLILDDEIVNMYLGFEKIGLPIHGFTDRALFLPRIFLPSRTPFLSGKKFYHASLLLETKKDYSIVVEYGGYDGEEITYKIEKKIKSCTTYYWWKKGHGLRYAEMSYFDYKNYKLDYDSYSERIFPLKCVRGWTLREVLRECNQSKIWSCANYDLAFQNCQDFVAKFIEVIGGYREEKTANRGLHNISSTKIPIVIQEKLEKNEDDGMNIVEKVPVIGPIIGAFYALFR